MKKIISTYEKFKESTKPVYYEYEFDIHRIWGKTSKYVCSVIYESVTCPISKSLKSELNNVACEITGYSNSYAKKGTIQWTAYREGNVLGSGTI